MGVPEEVMSWKLERVREEAVVARRRRTVQGGGRSLMVAMLARWGMRWGEGEEVWVAGKVGRSVGGGLAVGWAGQSFRDPYTCTPGWARIRGGSGGIRGLRGRGESSWGEATGLPRNPKRGASQRSVAVGGGTMGALR